jgi:hypothetical protein
MGGARHAMRRQIGVPEVESLWADVNLRAFGMLLGL